MIGNYEVEIFFFYGLIIFPWQMGSLLPLEQFEREKGNPKSPRIKICTSVVVLQLSIEKHAGRIETLRRVIPELNPAILRFYNYRLSIFRTNSLL